MINVFLFIYFLKCVLLLRILNKSILDLLQGFFDRFIIWHMLFLFLLIYMIWVISNVLTLVWKFIVFNFF